MSRHYAEHREEQKGLRVVAERWFLPDADRELRIDRRLANAESEEFV